MEVSEGASMTMLDRMRRHRDWLSGALVWCAWRLSSSTFPISSAAARRRRRLERHRRHGRTATKSRAADFRRTYQAQLQAYRSAYGGNMSEQLLKQLGIEQQILQQMVDERAALAEADRLGIKVSDEEVRQRIFAMPAFQENGGFIGETRYQQLLRMQRPPMTPAEFEDNVRRALTVEKLRAVAHRLAVGARQGARAGIPAPQRQGEARGRQLHRRQLPHPGQRDATRKSRATSTRTRTTSRFPRSARSATC